MKLRSLFQRFAPFVCLAVAAGGCGERALQDEGASPSMQSPDAGSGNAPADATPDAQVTVSLPPGVTPATAVPVTKTAGTCADPDGAPYLPPTPAELAAVLVGRWQRCSGDQVIRGVRAGMQLGRDRRWQSLDGNGDSLSPATGFDSTGVWWLNAEDPNDMVTFPKNVLRIQLDGDFGATGYPVDVTQGPTKIRVGGAEIYVWLGE